MDHRTAPPGATRSPAQTAKALMTTSQLDDPAGKSFGCISDPSGRTLARPHAPVRREGGAATALADGGVVGLVDISKHGGSLLLDRITSRLRTDYPKLTCKRYTKKTFARPMHAELASQIARECSRVVLALGD